MDTNAQSQQPQNLGTIIDTYRALYDQRAALNAESKGLTRQLEELAPKILGQLDDLGIDSAKGKVGLVRVEEKIRPSVKDWDAFYGYIRENDAWFLLERRPTALAYADMIKAGETVPGTEPVHLREIICSAV
jgi:hypothetical protein